MTKTFKCNICGLKMSVTGSRRGIQAVGEMFARDHRHENMTDVTQGTDAGFRLAQELGPGLFGNRKAGGEAGER